MARYQLTLAYDGTDFFGSQRQAKRRTAQGELEMALRGLGWTDRSALLSGRTDSGVHATGQVAACNLDWAHTDDELVRALNAKLPGDISVWDAKIVRDDFHPRFDAISRTYSYQLFCDALRNPIRERFAWRVNHALDDDLLKQASQTILGAHDFSSFGSPTTPKGTTMRTVKKAEWIRVEKDQWRFEVEADAFLYRMVRRLVFAQVAAGQGKLHVDAIAESLARQAGNRKRSALRSGLAPAHGLTLIRVKYQESIQ
ncbi:MAG TPA: tRNA pseudouridine(38-40) synthase TruA [Anaerolineales bacterium]|jgi:tRNA pseudouridine38-40 synthase|nr:tRNA pseudouridine(38-40) synthase TruA [Anaerolineales bacterium]HQX15889.1 tRNA pseudouridine(38-40) synthase TruA [Anaerolineales bacterium]